MDMRVYYRKMREIEASLPDGAIVVISLETPDGGTAGVATEVTRRNAAKMVLDMRARVASEEEEKRFREAQLESIRSAEQYEASRRIQVAVVPATEWRSAKGGSRPSKE